MVPQVVGEFPSHGDVALDCLSRHESTAYCEKQETVAYDLGERDSA